MPHRHLAEAPMRWLTSLAAVTLLAACASSVHINTTVAPDAHLGRLHTFRVMTPPPRSDGRVLPSDPMLDNSITNRALREDLENAFGARGYTRDGAAPDFTIAYYASTKEKLDVRMWNYGYRGRWGGWHEPPGYVADPFTEGTVIVDVVDGRSHELLWRGRGVTRVSDDPDEYIRELRKVAKDIVDKFPKAGTGGN
jgi:hypothetical protein